MRFSDRLLLSAFAVAILAVGAASDARAQGVNATVVLPGFRGIVRLDTVGTTETVRGTPATVFNGVRAAFDSLGIEQAMHDSSGGLVGNLGLKVTRRLAGQAMSHWIDCGVGHNGPTANAYRVHLAILVSMAPAAGGATAMHTAVAAGAQAISGPLADPIACQSTGALEQRLLELARARVESR